MSSAATRLLALLGNPVSHSLSPALHSAAIAAGNLDAVYVALRCDARDAAALLRGIARAGGGGNVTAPHKGVAAAALDRPHPGVARTGACNTFWSEGDQVHGDNTDVEGVCRAVADLLGGPPAGARVLLVGAGGAAAAALCALLDAGASAVVVCNRNPSRVPVLIERVAPDDGRAHGLDAAASLGGEAFDLVVNATPLGGNADDPLPLSLDVVQAGAVLDLVYRRGETAWVRTARERDIPAADGRGVLVAQAEAAWRRWWGSAPPEGLMAAALAASERG